LRAGEDKRGLSLPWCYIRDKLAERWHCKPWEVDDSPIGEVERALELMHIENTVKPAAGTSVRG
jgi:hypothetical protein